VRRFLLTALGDALHLVGDAAQEVAQRAYQAAQDPLAALRTRVSCLETDSITHGAEAEKRVEALEDEVRDLRAEAARNLTQIKGILLAHQSAINALKAWARLFGRASSVDAGEKVEPATWIEAVLAAREAGAVDKAGA